MRRYLLTALCFTCTAPAVAAIEFTPGIHSFTATYTYSQYADLTTHELISVAPSTITVTGRTYCSGAECSAIDAASIAGFSVTGFPDFQLSVPGPSPYPADQGGAPGGLRGGIDLDPVEEPALSVAITSWEYLAPSPQFVTAFSATGVLVDPTAKQKGVQFESVFDPFTYPIWNGSGEVDVQLIGFINLVGTGPGGYVVPFTDASFFIDAGTVFKTAQEYAQQVLDQAIHDHPSANAWEIARFAYRNAIDLREAGDSSEELKEVEYFFRGYTGGLLAGDLSHFGEDGDYANDTANFLTLVSAPIYNGLKSLGLMSSTGSQPISPPGGTDWAEQGWFFGSAGYSPQDALDAYFGGVEPPAPPPTPPGSLEQPNQLSEPFDLPGLAGAETSLTPLNVNADSIYYFDPAASKEFLIAVYGTELSGLIIPDLYDDKDFLLSYLGGSLLLDTGTFYDFLNLGIGNQDWLDIKGLDTGDGDLVFGVTFAQASPRAGLSVTTIGSSVPEPSSWMMLLLGFGMLGSVVRRNKKYDVQSRRTQEAGFTCQALTRPKLTTL